MGVLHTPWIAHEYGSPVGHWYVRNSNDETINYPLAESDAFLFAAAPDLLTALKRLLAVSEMTTFSDQYPAECWAANEAILKAEGDGEAGGVK